ncbi:MAG: RNA methyltransferase [Oscillospiraceae bacterium]|nr:RNA methyltransferase [Oscillospiraceae bacterium]
MEKISSRKNAYISHVRLLSSDTGYRREQGQYLCDGIKTLKEAVRFGAEIVSVLWKGQEQSLPGLDGCRQYVASEELFDYASPMKNSPGPLFVVKAKPASCSAELKRAIVLENLQDPGNVGTVIRTANALGIDAVILVGNCADLYNPKTVRATMGAIFRQRVIQTDMEGLSWILRQNDLKLYGAALTDRARDIGTVDIQRAAVAIGSEGQGLSPEFLAVCDGQLIIPMEPDSESFNAAVAAAIVMWEMRVR